MKIRELAQLIDGTLEGNGDIDIKKVSGMKTAKSGDLTFAIDEDRLSVAERSNASCVLMDKSVRKSTKPAIRVANPKLSFIIIYNILNKSQGAGSFKHPSAIISNAAFLADNVWVGPNVTIEEGVTIKDHVVVESNSVIKKNCIIGPFCHIYPNVTLYENVEIHKNVILHSGIVIGADGFGYVKDKGRIYKFPQLGRVIIEDDVEIGSNTTIDRGSLNDTVIGVGTKIDNLCQIGHNVSIGKNVIMAAQCGISGSTVIGNNVTMGGQVGIVDNVKIGDNVTIGAKSAVIGSIKSNTVVWGIPARPIAQTKRQMAVLSWATNNFKRIRNIINA